MKYAIDIKRASTDDIQDLIDVQNKAFLDDYKKYGVCPGYGHTFESMSSLVEKHKVYKIVAEGTIVGDIIVHARNKEEYFLGCLCVIPEFENNGIVQAAMKF